MTVKFNDIKDKIDMLEMTITLFGHSMKRKLGQDRRYFENEEIWADSYLIHTNVAVYEISFISSKDKGIESADLLLYHGPALTEYLKSIYYPIEEQIDEIINFLMTLIGD
ncbi:hypothetical protein D3C87_76450 [compost metagenome]